VIKCHQTSDHLASQQAEHAVSIALMRLVTPPQDAMLRTTLLTSASWSEKAKNWLAVVVQKHDFAQNQHKIVDAL
jgi:hypothetical protein